MTKECLYLCVCCTVAAALAGPVSRVTAEGPATAIRAPVSETSSRPISLGLLPVSASGSDERSVMFRGLVESGLDLATARLPNVDVVDRTRIDKVLKELAFSKLGRQDLQAGQIVGAEVLLAASLSPGDKDQTLELAAVETATGNILLSRKSSVGDEAAVNDAVTAFIAGLPAKLVRAPHVADVALLTITHSSPFPVKGELAEDLRRRLSKKLAELNGVRVLYRELGQFVLVESQLAAAGLVDPHRKFAPVAGTISISGNLRQELANGQPIDQSSLTLELTVMAGKARKVVRTAGTLATAADMELSAARDLCAAVAELARTTAAPEITLDDRDRRFWEGQKYLAMARAMVNLSDDRDAKNQAACELVTKAAALMPESPEPYEIVYNLDMVRLMHSGPQIRQAQTLLSSVRRRFIDGFPGHRMWAHAVMVDQYSLLGFDLAGPGRPDQAKLLMDKRGKEAFQQAMDLAMRLSGEIIAGRNGPCESGEMQPSLRLLMMDGQYDRALRMCEAARRTLLLCGWSPLNHYVSTAIDLGQLDWAYRAAQAQRKFYPGYCVQWLERNGRLAKLQAAADFERWKPIIQEADRKAAREARAETINRLPDWGQTCLADRQRLDNLAARRAAEGSVMSVSSQGGGLLAVLRKGNKYLLWTVSEAKPVELVGLVPLVPPEQLMGYVMRPAIASFDGKVYIGAERLGFFEADAASGKTARVCDGFPDGSVHALVVDGGFLYAAGGGKDAGFIARRQAGKREWQIWIAPKSCGPVRRLAPQAKGPWRIYHDVAQRISLFDTQDGKWEEGYSVEQYAFAADCLAATGGMAIFFNTDWDTQRPMYMLDEPTKAVQAIYFPPGDLSVYQAILDRHEVFWRWNKAKDATVAPLAQHPVDAVVADGCFWILDAAGGLTATRDGRSFAGPYMAAQGAQSMCLDEQGLCINSGQSLVFVPRKLLTDILGRKEAFRDWREVLSTAQGRLKKWIDAQPADLQVRYFNKIARPDLAAKITATQPVDPAAAVETARANADKLVEAGKFKQAIATLDPYVADLRLVADYYLESSYLYALQKEKQWQRILEFVPRLWSATVLGDNVQVDARNNAYFAAVTLSSGTISGVGTLTGSSYALTDTGTISANLGANSATLTKTGTGTATLSGTNAYTGATTVNGGTLDLGGGTAAGSLLSTVLNLGDGTFAYTRTGNTTQSFTTTNINAGASAITAVAGDTLNLGALVQNGGTVNIGNTGTITTSTANTNGILGAWATFGGTTWAVANGPSSAITGIGDEAYIKTSVALNDQDKYTDKYIDVDSSQTPTAAITPNSLRFNTAGASTTTLQGTNVLTSGGILVTPTVGANLSTITGGTLAGAASADLVVTQNNTNTGGGLTIASNIVNNTGATGLTKSGAGLLTLTGANAYTGGTTVNAGTLQLGAGGATGSLSTSSAISVASGATFAVAQTDTVTQGTDFSAAAITGAGGFTQAGTGTTVLNAVNTYTGATTITTGTLEIGGSGQLGGGTYSNTITINPGATFKYNSDADQTFASGGTGGVLRGGGSFIKDGDGTLTVSEDSGAEPSSNLFTGPITINKGTLKMDGEYAFYNNAGTYTIASGAVLDLDCTDWAYPATGTTINGAGTLRFSSSVAGVEFMGWYETEILRFELGSGGLIDLQANVSMWDYPNFTWTNNRARLNVDGELDLYKGPSVFVDALTGAGKVTDTNGTGSSTLTVGVAGGSGTFTGTIAAGNQASSVAFTKTGTGTQILTGANTYTGATTVGGGKLTIDANSINSTSGVSIGAGEFNYNSATALSKNVVFTGTGGTLSGTGTISTAVTVTSGNTLAPGSGVGSLSLGAGLTIAAGGIFNWENNGVNTLGTGDVVNVVGTTTISSIVDTGSQLDLQFAAGTSFSNAFWNTNRSWEFITGGVTAGNLFDASNIDIFIDDVQQGSDNIITREGAFTTAVSGSNLQLVWTTVLHGDTNGDNVVDAADYIAIKTNLGLTGTGATLEKGNVTGAMGVDGTVDWDDLQLLMANFGKTLGAPATPEPATLGLLAIGALALLRRRRRAA